MFVTNSINHLTSWFLGALSWLVPIVINVISLILVVKSIQEVDETERASKRRRGIIVGAFILLEIVVIIYCKTFIQPVGQSNRSLIILTVNIGLWAFLAHQLAIAPEMDGYGNWIEKPKSPRSKQQYK